MVSQSVVATVACWVAKMENKKAQSLVLLLVASMVLKWAARMAYEKASKLVVEKVGQLVVRMAVELVDGRAYGWVDWWEYLKVEESVDS